MPLSAHITAIDYYLPEKVVTSAQLQEEFGDGISNGLIDKLGIKARHIARKDEVGPDMAIMAAEKLFANYNIDRNSIDGLIYNSMHTYYPIPATSGILQHKLGLPNHIFTMDHIHGCSGYTYSLAMAKAAIESLGLKKVLILTATALTQRIYIKDKASRLLFGDAASATVIEAVNDGKGMGQFLFGTDGKGYDTLMIKDGADLYPISETSYIEREDEYGNITTDAHFYMNGERVLRFIVGRIPAFLNDVIKKNGLEIADIDLFVLHQANNFLNAQLPKLLKADPDKFYNNITFTGNTVQATIPIALKAAMAEGKIKPGSKVLVAGFGIGLSWSGTIIRF